MKLVLRCAWVHGLVAAAFLAALPPATAQARRYTITNLGSRTSSNVVGGLGLSDTGYVTAYAFPGGSAATKGHGFRWADGGMLVPHAPSGAPTWLGFDARAVNDAGAFIGWFGIQSTTSLERGYLWRNGVATELLAPDGQRAFPWAINDLGVVVGRRGAQPGGQPGAVIWDASGAASYVGTLDAASAINDVGQIAGVRRKSSTNTDYLAYLWDQGVETPLGSLDPQGQGSAWPWAINSGAVIVGQSDVGGQARPFVWDALAGIQALPRPGSAGPGPGIAVGVNDGGWIVGWTQGVNSLEVVLWSPQRIAHVVDPLVDGMGPGQVWDKLGVLQAINNHGQLSGWAILTTSQATRAVLLTPAELSLASLGSSTAGGPVTFEVDGAQAGESVLLAYALDDAFDEGYRRLPGCGGMGLSLRNPRVAAAAKADAGGQAVLSWAPPAALAGIPLRLQAFQRTTCDVSNVVRLTP